MLHDDVEISGVPAKVEEGNGSKTTSELGETVETAAETLEEVVQVEQTVTQALGEIVQVGEMEQTVTLALGEMEQTVTLALGETVRVGETAALALGETVHVEQTVTQAPEVQIGETITMEESENVGHMKQGISSITLLCVLNALLFSQCLSQFLPFSIRVDMRTSISWFLHFHKYLLWSMSYLMGMMLNLLGKIKHLIPKIHACLGHGLLEFEKVKLSIMLVLTVIHTIHDVIIITMQWILEM